MASVFLYVARFLRRVVRLVGSTLGTKQGSLAQASYIRTHLDMEKQMSVQGNVYRSNQPQLPKMRDLAVLEEASFERGHCLAEGSHTQGYTGAGSFHVTRTDWGCVNNMEGCYSTAQHS